MRHFLSSAVLLLCICSLTSTASAQSNAQDYVVALTASVQQTPAQISLSWKNDAKATKYTVRRRTLGKTLSWDVSKTLKATDSAYVDNTVNANTAYEYSVVESAKSGSTTWTASGFIATGIAVPAQVSPGTVILVIDNTYVTPLAPQLAQLQKDLQAEGWNIIRHDVNRTDAVTDVKALIVADYEADPDYVRTVFLIGHVPVPYSGDIVPDGHVAGSGNHQGAWPADVYYGSINGDWTDEETEDITAYDPRNKNVIGDGKFDQNAVTSPMDLEVGRVDLYQMPAFSQSDTVLMRRYFDRDHAFRTGKLVVPKRALVNINFGVFASYDVPGEDAWRNFPVLVGNDNIVNFHSVSSAGDWFSYLDTAKYLWAYGCGGGSWNSCGGVGVTSQYATKGTASLFYMLFGSFFGDWDVPDNFTRGPLGTDYGLISCWVSRPFWYFHPLGIGQTFGYCTKITQSNGAGGQDYNVAINLAGVHVALMGDPTLRQQYLSEPPTALSAILETSSVKLTWTAPSASVMGYNVYRAPVTQGAMGSWEKLTATPVTTTSYTDMMPMSDSSVYMVRAAELLTTPSGSYYNESGGIMQGIRAQFAVVPQYAEAASNFRVSKDGDFLNIHLNEATHSSTRLTLVDITGREIAVIHDGPLSTGSYSYRVNLTPFASGAYFLRLISEGTVQTAKVIR